MTNTEVQKGVIEEEEYRVVHGEQVNEVEEVNMYALMR